MSGAANTKPIADVLSVRAGEGNIFRVVNARSAASMAKCASLNLRRKFAYLPLSEGSNAVYSSSKKSFAVPCERFKFFLATGFERGVGRHKQSIFMQ